MIMRPEHAVAAAKQTGHERSANIEQFEQDFS
ncbi:hypothetical protein X760_31505 [Mesorhizobium sp. LSHC422A00]|nr:hypothetical protein X762_28070 [Mesorhizobium sp. LSHC426A00]ESX51576.1 hypothetical protein X760_31505 [Mesorhizobium sp. LSHC422A00]